MLKILQREDWVAEVETIRPLKLNEQLEVINSVCSIFECQPIYYLYQRKGKCIVSFIALVRNRIICEPIHFFYSPIWINESLNDLKYIEYLTDFIKELKNRYNQISIRLPTGYTDIRPFLWNGFSVVNNYTYIKKLHDLTYSSVVRRNLEKANDLKLEFRQENLTEESMHINLSIFKNLRFRKTKILQIQNLMEKMSKTTHFTCFNCYDGSRLVASMQVFFDTSYRIAYLILLNQHADYKKTNVHTSLHHFMFLTLKNKGYEFLDLMGGDIKGISAFKTSFNASLAHHYTLRYDWKQSLLGRIKDRQINLLRRILTIFS